MGEAEEALNLFRKFLESIPLDKLREETVKIKRVEQDLPKEILPLESIFRHYWENKQFLEFDEWFENFWKELHDNPKKKEALEKFKLEYFNGADEEWFKEGFRARMYRTWTAILTQLDFCYAFAYICEKLNKKYKLIANAELDRKGIDLRVNNIDFQVTKISERKEARPTKSKKQKVIIIPYPVFNLEKLKRLSQSTKVKPENRKKYENIIRTFYRYYSILKNGFVVFNTEFVKEIVENLENVEKLENFISGILSNFSKK
jgi:hypothetical protein